MICLRKEGILKENFVEKRIFRVIRLPFYRVVFLAAVMTALAAEKPNVLFIIVDDLANQLHSYGRDYVISPSIDKLSRDGVLFKRAYAQVPVCGASRCSFLSGIRPHNSTFNLAKEELQKYYPKSTTLPKAFRDAGYHTIGVGKVFHVATDMPNSWDESPAGGDGNSALDEDEADVAAERGPMIESPNVADNQLSDGQRADKAISTLRRMKNHGKPFFLAVGFAKPHLPFIAPKKYFDMYNRNEIPIANNLNPPKNAPNEANSGGGEIQLYGSGNLKFNSPEFHRTARHAYSACVTYVDAQIGRVLDELEKLGLKDNTLVMMIGDHGFLLGEHNHWGKHSLLHESIATPLIVSGPGIPKNEKRENLVELVDVFPSFLELAGIPQTAALKEQLQGMSFAPVLKDANAPWKIGVYSKWLKVGDGVTLVTQQYSYTEYGAGGKGKRMLFDLVNDPEETANISELPGNAATVEKLSKILKGGWKNVPVETPKITNIRLRHPNGLGVRNPAPGEMKVYSISGELLRTVNIEEQRAALTSGILDVPGGNGTYLYSIQPSEGAAYQGKLVVHDRKIMN